MLHTDRHINHTTCNIHALCAADWPNNNNKEIINWRKDELEAMDRKTRKMMAIYNSLHSRDYVDRLHVPESMAEED